MPTYLIHSAKGTTWSKEDAKYVTKTKKNGKWVYTYTDPNNGDTYSFETMMNINLDDIDFEAINSIDTSNIDPNNITAKDIMNITKQYSKASKKNKEANKEANKDVMNITKQYSKASKKNKEANKVVRNAAIGKAYVEKNQSFMSKTLSSVSKFVKDTAFRVTHFVKNLFNKKG